MSSGVAMTEARDESLIRLTKELPSAGTTDFSACGRMTYRMLCHAESPSALAASPCPTSTDWMPARIVSAMYAPALIESASAAERTPSGFFMKRGTMPK